jgi:hypothetical protein
VVRSDELWLWHSGGPLELRLGGSGGEPVSQTAVLLGSDWTPVTSRRSVYLAECGSQRFLRRARRYWSAASLRQGSTSPTSSSPPGPVRLPVGLPLHHRLIERRPRPRLGVRRLHRRRHRLLSETGVLPRNCLRRDPEGRAECAACSAYLRHRGSDDREKRSRRCTAGASFELTEPQETPLLKQTSAHLMLEITSKLVARAGGTGHKRRRPGMEVISEW